MRAVEFLDRSQTIKIGKEPLVLVPLSLWRKAEEFLEDQEAMASARYLRRIGIAMMHPTDSGGSC